MNKLEKLLRKISQKERKSLLDVMLLLSRKDIHTLDIAKIKGTDMYRARVGNFRIIFHYENDEVVIVSVRQRSEKTYK